VRRDGSNSGGTRGRSREEGRSGRAHGGRRGVKASRPLIRVLVINDNGLWINNSF
jgi:hypothetical protein